MSLFVWFHAGLTLNPNYAFLCFLMEEKTLQKHKIYLGMWNCKYDARIFVVLNIIDKNFNMNIYDIRSALCQSVRLSSIS